MYRAYMKLIQESNEFYSSATLIHAIDAVCGLRLAFPTMRIVPDMCPKIKVSDVK